MSLTYIARATRTPHGYVASIWSQHLSTDNRDCRHNVYDVIVQRDTTRTRSLREVAVLGTHTDATSALIRASGAMRSPEWPEYARLARRAHQRRPAVQSNNAARSRKRAKHFATLCARLGVP